MSSAKNDSESYVSASELESEASYESDDSISEASFDDESDTSSMSHISITPRKGKIKKALNSKLGFTDRVCKFGDSSCRNRNILFLIVSFAILFGAAFFLLKKMRPKIILDEKGHVSQKKLILYSIIIGLLGPVLYFTYAIMTM